MPHLSTDFGDVISQVSKRKRNTTEPPEPTLKKNKHTPNQEGTFFTPSEKQIASTALLSLALVPEIINHVPEEKYINDSQKVNEWVTEWKEEYGSSYILESLGRALLDAATLLQKQKSPLHQQKNNPVIQFAVKFLLMSIAHLDDPTEEQRALSSVYAALLKPFTMFSIFELSPKYYLEHLRLRFVQSSNMPSFHNLSIEEMVDVVFQTLASTCTEKEYDLIVPALLKSIQNSDEEHISTESSRNSI
ncbi:hypothetical protein [Legionella rowbothamii]|uniref:hypothetical protein n=1 Tax=Legionella rowbothamii TaxID=96229 RepID=UPI0010560584|nr:hypothetical protein [Legionella rowbothamii]